MTRDFSEATTHPEKVRPSSAVSRWSMDSADVSSGTINDSWGSNDGTLNGGVTTGASGVGGGEAFSFDGSDDYINCGSDVSLSAQLPMTISAWINLDVLPSDKGDDERVLSKWPGGDVGYLFQIEQNYDQVRWLINDGSANHEVNASSYKKLETDKWYNIVGSVGANGEMKLYINGVLIGKNGAVFSVESSTSTDLLIGRYNASRSSKLFNGKVDEVRIYSEALSQQQIWKLYNIGRNANWGFSRS